MRKQVSCVNKTCLSRGGGWQKEPLAGRLCQTQGEGSPRSQVSSVCWEPSEACLVSGSQCPLPVPALRLPSRSETSQSWSGAAPSCCSVLQTPQVQRPGWVLSPAPHVVSLCQHLGQGGEPHPPVGFCQSKISPVDDLGGCLGP